MATHKIDRIIIIDHDLYINQTFVSSLIENFNVSVELLLDLELFDKSIQNVIYVSTNFEGPIFDQLVAHKKPIISDIIVEHCISNRIALPFSKHPLFNYHMKDFVICFSTHDKRQTNTINRYLNLIRFMGGQSRRDMKSGKSFERTHLIESSTDSENYKVAVIYGIPILNKEWIDFIWNNKRTPDFDPSHSSHVAQFKLKPLVGLKISLLNFSVEQAQQLSQEIIECGGEVLSLGDEQNSPFIDENCSHLVIHDSTNIDFCSILERSVNLPKYVVTEKWLLSSLRTQNRDDEDGHKLKVPRLETEILSNTPSKNDSIAHTTLNSLLLSPNYDKSFDDSIVVDKGELKKQAITQELFQTEVNYVAILKDIIKIFRDPLKSHQTPGALPNEIELKTIFGGLPPIIEVHSKILVELEPVVKSNCKENSVGKIFQKHSQDFLTVYPQYVNFYEQTKEMIELCTEKYPQFSKFLRACQTLPECKKQTFQELLINPIQRLPRIEMYLRALLNKTDNLHPDYKPLNEALNTIVSVNSEINQEKKKTEGQMEMFDMLNDIEDCPATLLSANRHFISKCDARLLMQADNGANKIIHKLDNYVFSLLLFTDLIVLCKKRHSIRRTNSLRERTSTISANPLKKTKKAYKYIETIDISMIKYIYNEFDNIDFLPDPENAFVFISHPIDKNFLTYPFVVVKESEMKKQRFINDIVKAFELLKDSDEVDVTVTTGNCNSLDFSHSKTIARNMNKSKYVLMRTKERINRTFSVRRSTAHLLSSVSMENLNSALPATPASNRISRVFTSFLTPKENHDPYLNRNARKVMGSINDLSTPEEVDGNFSLPTTPAPRKKKFQESNS